MKIFFNLLLFLCVFLFTITFSFAQSDQNIFSLDKFFEKYKFPYRINFTEKETTTFDSLKPETKLKIIQYSENLYKTRTATNTSAATSSSTTSSTVIPPKRNTQSALSNLLNSVFPKTFPQTNSPKYPAYSGLSGLNDSDPSSNPNFNPNSAPQDVPFARNALTEKDIADFSKLPPDTTGKCSRNYGVDGDMNNLLGKIKIDTTCLCIAFNGRIKMLSGYRTSSVIGNRSAHVQGLAIDIAENNFKDPQKDAMFVVALIALGYNIGSYHPGFGSFHADKENSSKWKTWSGVAHTNYQGGYARNYYSMIRDALNIIGTPAVSAAQFRSTYGNQSISAMAQKARKVIETNGNEKLKQCISI